MAASPPGPGAVTPAEHLVRRGTQAAAQGRLLEAADAYRQAADLHRKGRRAPDEARTLLLLAQCRRLAGDVEGAAGAANRARRVGSDDTSLSVAAAAEMAEIELARGNPSAAVARLDEALEQLGDEGGRTSAALHRRRAMVRTVMGDPTGADRDFVAAARQFAAAGEDKAARTVQVERATALHSSQDATWTTALAEARAVAEDASDRALSGELDLLEVAGALDRGDVERAGECATSARDHALAVRSPMIYIGATSALATLADRRGDRVDAYRVLATGWATLGDLLGDEQAAQVFRPRLQELETSWGAEEFAAIRAEYEDTRRRELGLA
jgi:tetratricopeptide (TPR) repeat protein